MDNVPKFTLHMAEQPAVNIAVFIDADNAPKGRLDDVFSELTKHGCVSIRRAFGNWKKLESWVNVLHKHAIQPVQVFDLIKGKNASDIAMVCDVMDVLYNKPVDVFCLVSSDCDFTPLVMKLRAEGKQVLGIGETKAPSPFRDACSDFIFLDEELEPETEALIKALEAATASPDPKPLTSSSSFEPKRRCTGSEMKNDAQLISWFREAIASTAGVNGWAGLSTIGAWLQKEKNFNPTYYGFKRLSDMIKVIDLFELDSTLEYPRVTERRRLVTPPKL